MKGSRPLIATTASEPDAARALVKFLTSPAVGFLIGTAEVPQVPDEIAAAAKGVSHVPFAAVSICSNTSIWKAELPITSSARASSVGGIVRLSEDVRRSEP